MSTSTTFIKDFIAFCQSHRLFSPNDKILVAVSGGVDSTVLLDLFLRIQNEWDLDVGVVHVNHQLRGKESMGDEEFVRQTSERARIPFHAKRVDTLELKHVLHVSKQVAAREARYQYFEEARVAAHANRVATAHQADDNAETVLFNALRGTGIRGLAGIPVSRDSGHYIRPLLFAERQRVLEYARENDIKFREDSSNATTVYSRNHLRHVIIPLLGEPLKTDPKKSLNRLSNSMRRFSRSLDSLVDGFLPATLRYKADACEVTLRPFLDMPQFLQEELLLRGFRHLGVEPSREKVQRVIDLCHNQPGHFLVLQDDVSVEKDHDQLVFSHKNIHQDYAIPVSLGQSYSLERFGFSLNDAERVPSEYAGDGRTEYVDGDAMQQPLTLRSWKHGDWFIPFGMKGRKKLSDYFADAKVPRLLKSSVPVLESNGNIVWVCGRRLDDRFKITDKTTHIVKLTYTPTAAI